MATRPAVLGSSTKLNNFRLGYITTALSSLRATRVRILLSGVLINDQVDRQQFSIHDVLNDAPNTCSLVIRGSAPSTHARLVVTLNSDTPRTLFSGTIQTVATTYEGRPSNVAYRCTAIDDTEQANRRRPFGSYTNVSASDVARNLVATYAPGLSQAGIADSLDAVSVNYDGTEGMGGAFSQLAKLIGGYFKFENGIAYLFLNDSDEPPDDIDTTPNRFLHDPPIASSSDVSQLRTRVYGKGHGEATLSDVAAHDTIIPVADVSFYEATGGELICLSQRLTFTATRTGGGGTLVGPGASPSSAPHLALATGSGVDAGSHGYAVTFVTASGQSLPSPVAAITTVAVPSAPSTAPTLAQGAQWPSGQSHGGVFMKMVYAFLYADGTESLPSADTGYQDISPFYGWDATIGVGGAGVVGRRVYQTSNSYGSPINYTYVADILDNTTTAFSNSNAFESGYHDIFFDAVPGTPLAGSLQQVALSSIPIGGTGVTSRKLYRTAVGDTQLKLLATIADNTTTTYTDSTADASLSTNAPTSDTSALSQPSGAVLAGATSLTVAGAGAFASAGGWAVIGNGQQVIRYTGLSGNSLTGIPSSGIGAITATIGYNSTITVPPELTGVTGIEQDIVRGSPVNIWVTRDDATARVAQSAIDTANSLMPADGLYEGPIIVDERRTATSLAALCDATLALFSTPIQTVRYATRDVKTRSGKPVTVNLTTPAITAELVIQDVTITEIDLSPGVAPRYSVTASTTRFSLDDLLRRLTRAALGGA